MTPEETQALVDRLRVERMNTTEWACRMYRESVSPQSVDHREVIKRADAALADALTALTALARDLAATKEAAEVIQASSKANAEEVRWLERDLETARQERDAAPTPPDNEAEIYEAIGRYAVQSARWIRHEHEHYAAVPVTLGANLESPGRRFDALRAVALRAALAATETPAPDATARPYIISPDAAYGEAMTRPRNDYHPGNITRGDDAFKQQSEPPLARRDVDSNPRPVLYDKDERPIYRRIGFTVTR